MNLIVWLIAGAVVGWVASMAMHTGARQGVVLNISVGLVGAFLAGWFVAPLIDTSAISQLELSPLSIGLSLVGAVALIAARSLFHRGCRP